MPAAHADLPPALTRSNLTSLPNATVARLEISGGERRGASAPVDAQLRLCGVGRLRVIDTSVMPTIPCRNTSAPTLLLAERTADPVLATS
jgi:choline dehydrogenase-like flavoprotein